MLLSQKDIPFLRIDGTVASTDRTAILSQFDTDPTIPVLLLTIDSGAVGLALSLPPPAFKFRSSNLTSLTITSANRVHIVEPIYNPATEAQAIARVLRMGQTRPVTIIKYITEKTVEPVESSILLLSDLSATYCVKKNVKTGMLTKSLIRHTEYRSPTRA
jgi:SWI/SNF-related matrix-associated actin-dependent regulator of chromatin subfamily A3